MSSYILKGFQKSEGSQSEVSNQKVQIATVHNRKVQTVKWGFIAMASEILIRIRSTGKERSHEKPLLKRSEYLYLNQTTKQTQATVRQE